MTDNELSLDQLRSISGADSNTNWKAHSYNMKELTDSGELVQQMKYIPGKM